MSHCVHLGRRAGEIVGAGPSVATFRCHHPQHSLTTLAECETCPHRRDETAAPTAPAAPTVGPQAFYLPSGDQHSDNRPVALDGLYRGASVFLTLGGPSMLTTPLLLLAQRGIIVASYNNNPAALPPPLRPHVWFHTDNARKFHDSIWRDPAILKFSPLREWRAGPGRRGKPYKGPRRRLPDGTFQPLEQRGYQLPGVIGYDRNTTFDPTRFLAEPSLNRGNCRRSAKANGYPHVINSMFTALKLLPALGFTTIYLVGADFRMDHARPYAFGQRKDSGGVNGNNEAFRKMDALFAILRPYLEAAGIKVYNTTRPSGLTAFEFRDFREAVAAVAGSFECEIDAGGWYDAGS